jgi:hypothetical protein
MRTENEVMKTVKLTSTSLESIAQRLQELVATDANVPALAYAGVMDMGRDGCGCKGGCDGGCTSW